MNNLIKDKVEDIRNSKLLEYSFLLGILVFSFSRVYQYSLILDLNSTFKTVLRLLSFVLLLPKVILQKYDKKDLPMVIALYVFTIICICFSNDKNMIIIPTLLIGCKDMDMKKVVKVIFVVTLSAVIIHGIWFMVDYTLKNNNFISMFHISGSIVKNTVMYRDNNMYAIRFVCCMMQYVYITNRERNRYIKALILFVLSIFMLFITQSRTSVIIALLIVLYLVFENMINDRISKTIVYISISLGILSSILLTIIGSFSLDNNVAYFFGKLLSGRPTIFNKAVNYIGINLLPSIDEFKNISSTFGRYTLPDNSYISLFIKWGLLIFIILCVFVYVLVVKNNNEKITNYYIGIMAIWFIVEYISIEYVMYIVPLLVVNNYFRSIERKDKQNDIN